MMFVVKLICRVAFRSAVVLGVFLAWLLLLSGTLPSAAQGWQWPAEMRLGGFYITGIQGNVNRDGSGSATGTAQIPGIAGQKALLTRSANGEISAEVSLGAKISGVELVGLFLLDDDGLRSRKAELRLIPYPIVDCAVSVDPNGRFVGTGKLRLRQLAVPVKFSISRDSFTLEGSGEVGSQVDTPLAKYTLSGTLDVASKRPQITATVSGIVERVGKLSSQSAKVRVSDVQVDVLQGTCTITVEGVAVTFRLF